MRVSVAVGDNRNQSSTVGVNINRTVLTIDGLKITEVYLFCFNCRGSRE